MGQLLRCFYIPPLFTMGNILDSSRISITTLLNTYKGSIHDIAVLRWGCVYG